MINGGLLFVVFIFVWIVFAVAKDYEKQAKMKEEEAEDNTQIKNKKVGKKNV